GVASDLEGIDLAGLPPVYPVVFGSDQPPRDIGIVNSTVTQAAFEDAPVTIETEVSATGCAGEEIVGRLFAIDPARATEEGKLVSEQTLTAPRENEKLVFRFQLRPEKTGVLFYRLRLAARHDPGTEATLVNNETIIAVDRGTGPY